MKKFFTLLVAGLLISSFGFSQTTLIEEDFEGFTVGDYVAQEDPSGFWTTWSNDPGSSEDAVISDDQNLTSGGDNSMLVSGTNDMVLLLGNKTTGEYTLSINYYVETGFGGYINIQHSEEMGVEWAWELYFNEDGSCLFIADGQQITSFSYPKDQWFEIFAEVSLDDDQITLTVDGVEFLTWQFSLQADGTAGTNCLGAVNIYAGVQSGSGETPKYYVDDIEYIETVAGVPHPEVELSATEYNVDGTANQTLTITNTGAEVLNFDALVNYPAPTSKKVSEINNTNTQTTSSTKQLVSMSSTKPVKPVEIVLGKDGELTHLEAAIATYVGWNSGDNVDAQASALFKYDNNQNSMDVMVFFLVQ